MSRRNGTATVALLVGLAAVLLMKGGSASTALPETPQAESRVDEATSRFMYRMIDLFPLFYLALISIIQGVALAALIVNTYSALGASRTDQWASVGCYAVALFLLIVIVTYEYSWYAALYNEPPAVRDVLLPLALGVAEIVPTYFLGSSQWWATSVAVTCGMGAVAYADSYVRAPHADIGQPLVSRLRTQYVRNIGACCLAVALLFIFAWGTTAATGWVVRHLPPPSGWLWSIVPAIVFVSLELFILFRSSGTLHTAGREWSHQEGKAKRVRARS